MKVKLYCIILCVVLGFTISISSVLADSPYVQIYIPGEYYSSIYLTEEHNSSNLWDSLDTPANINLTDLGDVNAVAPADDELLSWDAATARWIARAVGGISQWIIDTSGGYFYNDTTTLYFNETQLNITIDSRASGLGDNSSWNESYANSLYVDVTGDTMTGDLDMFNNNIFNVSNYTGEKINVTCCVYLGTIQATDGNSIKIQPTGDIDDYFSFKTPADRPTIKREGGKFIYFDSSNVYDVGLSLRDDDTYSGTLNYEKDNHKMTLLGKASPVAIKTNSEYVNYFMFETYNHQPQLSIFNGTFLRINDSLEVFGSINSTENITADYFIGDGSLLTGITGDNSSWNESFATTLYYLKTIVDTNFSLYYPKTDIDTNFSNYILTTEEGNLNVNQSDYWDNMGTINATQMENSGGTLNIMVSWLTSLFYTKSEVYTKAEVDTNITGQGYIKSTNVAYQNETGTFTENQTFEGYLNITGGILLNDNATISRSGVDTKTWISETGNLITKF